MVTDNPLLLLIVRYVLRKTSILLLIALFCQLMAYGCKREAQYYLELARLEGKDAKQNDLEAFVWWTIAARQYHLEYMNRIKNMKELFNKEDLAEINVRAND